MLELFSSERLTVIESRTCENPVKSSFQFDKVDLDLSKSKAWQNKTSKGVASFKVPVSVAIIIGGRWYQTPTNLREKVPFRQDCVNLVLTNNVSEPRHPMTAWIIAHRMCHALQLKTNTKIDPPLIENDFWSCVFAILKSMRIVDNSALCKDNKMHEADMLRIANLLMTTKSGRDQKIIRSIDVLAELFAQYLCSNVSLDTLENVSNKSEIFIPYNAKKYFLSNEHLIERLISGGFWERKELFERMIQRYVNRVVRSQIGKELII